MGRLSRALKRVVKVSAPIAFPAIAPLMALSARRAEPPVAPDEVATPTPGGGFLPRLVEMRQRARGLVQEEIAPLVEGTPFEIVDRDDDDFEEEEFDPDEEEDFEEDE